MRSVMVASCGAAMALPVWAGVFFTSSEASVQTNGLIGFAAILDDFDVPDVAPMDATAFTLGVDETASVDSSSGGDPRVGNIDGEATQTTAVGFAGGQVFAINSTATAFASRTHDTAGLVSTVFVNNSLTIFFEVTDEPVDFELDVFLDAEGPTNPQPVRFLLRRFQDNLPAEDAYSSLSPIINDGYPVDDFTDGQLSVGTWRLTVNIGGSTSDPDPGTTESRSYEWNVSLRFPGVPAPGSASLLPIGLVALARRRR